MGSGPLPCLRPHSGIHTSTRGHLRSLEQTKEAMPCRHVQRRGTHRVSYIRPGSIDCFSPLQRPDSDPGKPDFAWCERLDASESEEVIRAGIEGDRGFAWGESFRATEPDVIEGSHIDNVCIRALFRHLHVEHEGKDIARIKGAKVTRLRNL